jgi:hypothetical protein
MTGKKRPVDERVARVAFMKVAAQDHCNTDCGDHHPDRLLISLGLVYTKEEMDRDREEILKYKF